VENPLILPTFTASNFWHAGEKELSSKYSNGVERLHSWIEAKLSYR
jgi:hypothetical protein